MALWLDWVATLDESYQDRNDGQNQQNVNKTAQCVRTHNAQQPQNQQNDGNRPEHVVFFPFTSGSDRPQEEYERRKE